jgi:hypothetical protein
MPEPDVRTRTLLLARTDATLTESRRALLQAMAADLARIRPMQADFVVHPAPVDRRRQGRRANHFILTREQ